MWPIIMHYQITFHEDYTISFLLIIFAKKYKYLNYFGLIHLVHKKATSNGFSSNSNYYLGILFFCQ